MARFVLTYANARNFPRSSRTISTTIQIWKLETRIGIEHTTILFIKILPVKLNILPCQWHSRQHQRIIKSFGDVRLDIFYINFINFKLHLINSLNSQLHFTCSQMSFVNIQIIFANFKDFIMFRSLNFLIAAF